MEFSSFQVLHLSYVNLLDKVERFSFVSVFWRKNKIFFCFKVNN